MFCRQCEQTDKSESCNVNGVCGKDSGASDLQDLLTHSLKGIAVIAAAADQLGISVRDKDSDQCLIEGLFTTVTNVNFDSEKLFVFV